MVISSATSYGTRGQGLEIDECGEEEEKDIIIGSEYGHSP